MGIVGDGGGQTWQFIPEGWHKGKKLWEIITSKMARIAVVRKNGCIGFLFVLLRKNSKLGGQKWEDPEGLGGGKNKIKYI